MSSFLVGKDHIDYLVTAARTYAADLPGVRDRTPQALGELFYRENMATVVGRHLLYGDTEPQGWDDIPTPVAWDVSEQDDLDGEELEEVAELAAECRRRYESYAFEAVADVDPGQAAMVAACWRYQRGRDGADDHPESWDLAEAVERGALEALPDERLVDRAAPRTLENLAGRDGYAWGWRRPQA